MRVGEPVRLRWELVSTAHGHRALARFKGSLCEITRVYEDSLQVVRRGVGGDIPSPRIPFAWVTPHCARCKVLPAEMKFLHHPLCRGCAVFLEKRVLGLVEVA